MKQEHLFKLSAMSIALFGAISQGYALECKIPMSVDSPNGSLDNCKLDTEATSNLLFNQSALLDISNSTFHITDSNLTLSGDYGVDLINISDSDVKITNSFLARKNLANGETLSEIIRIKEGQKSISNLTLNGVTLVSTGETSAISLSASDNENGLTSVTLKDSTISAEEQIFGSWWSTSRPIKEYANLNIELDNSTLKAPIIMASGGLDELYKEDGVVGFEKTNLSARNSTLQGAITGDANITENSTFNLSLTDSSWIAPTYLSKEENLVAQNSIKNLNLQNSQITLQKNNGFQTLTIQDKLSGNGHFNLNTDLANQQSDKIIVKGEDSGNFTLGIQDSGNEPQAANGKVTLVETQQGQAKFSLKDRDYVDAGAYRYRLHQEGTNWVLANRQAEKTTANPPVAPVKPTAPVPTQPLAQTTPSVAQTQPTVQPTQPSVPTAPALLTLSEKTNALVSLRQAQGVLLRQNLQGIHQRLGEVRTDKSSNVWVKNLNSRSEAKAQNVATDSRSSGFEMDSHSLQIGAVRAINENLRLGGFVGTSRADVDFEGEYGKGKLRSQAVGFYATFANEQGWYLDNVAKYERLAAESNSEKRKYNAFGVSSEIGKRFTLSNDWVVTPQAQLAYHTINGKADEERLNLLVARAGVRVAKDFALNNGWNLQPYVEVNGIAEKANSAKVQVNQYQFEVAENKGRVQGSLGFTAGNGNHRLGLGASVASGNKLKQPFNVLANYRYQW